jgi:superfamily II DNA/RNA helicase
MFGDAKGKVKSISEERTAASNKFNAGSVRFLVSTEAAGEGIDLQESAYTLIHVDLPWNPMRLHQRVGRLNRYGQKHRVEVMTLRNPSTVESLIWEKLNEKIDSIMQSVGEVMDEPEDLLELVLGMTSPKMFSADRALGAFLGVVKSNRSSSIEGVVSNLTNATGTSGRQHSTNTPRHGYTVRPVPTVQTITSLENCRFP